MLWKCCTQYASKFGKLSKGHRTGKVQFSFQSLRKAMPKNAQTTAQLHSSHWGFPHSSVGKESTCSAGNPSSIPGSGRSAGEGIGYPLQYACASLVAQLVKNLPALRENWLWSQGLEDPWRRERLTTPVFWPRELHGLYSPWDHKESDTTEWLSLHNLISISVSWPGIAYINSLCKKMHVC